MKVQKSTVYSLFYGLLVFIFSIYVLPHYIYSDQQYYRLAYENCFEKVFSIKDELLCYSNYTGSKEPGYVVLAKLAQLITSKDIFISFANSVFAFFVSKLVFRYHKRVWYRNIFILLILFNFYSFVLYFSAERLKFGLLFLLISFYFFGKTRLFLMAVAVLTHVQAIMLLAPYYVYNTFTSSKSIFRRSVEIVFPVIAMSGLLYFLKDHLISKIESMQSGDAYSVGVFSALKVSLFIFLAVFTTKRISVLVAGFPLIVFAYFLGSERLSILAFIFLLCATTYFNKKMDVFLLILFSYFIYKGVGFLENIFVYGSGFPS